MTITADDLARAIYEHIVALRKKHTSHHMVSWEELSPSTRAQADISGTSPQVSFIADSAGAPDGQSTSERFLEKLSEWQPRLAPHLLRAMRTQIERLLGDGELEEDGVSPSLRSFDDLLEFLSTMPWIKAPAVGITRRGEFQVSWQVKGAPANIVLVFLGDRNVRWYRTDRRDPAHIRHATGISP